MGPFSMTMNVPEPTFQGDSGLLTDVAASRALSAIAEFLWKSMLFQY